MRRGCLAIFVACCISGGSASAADAPLALLNKIPLGSVRGTFGSVAMDAARGRVMIAETHNDSVAVIDLAAQSVIKRITGLNLPLDVDYVGKVQTFVSDTIYVANGGDGKVRIFDATDFSSSADVMLSGEVENMVLDADYDHILVGHGDGAISVLDASSPRKLSEIPLKAHPEEFMIDAVSSRIYAAVPNRGVISVIDRVPGTVLFEWKVTGGGAFNAIALTKGAVLVASQAPAKLISVGVADGKVLSAIDACGEADDVIADPQRGRAYMICGDGNIDVFQIDDSGQTPPSRLARIPTSIGAHTAALDARSGRLYLAVPAKGSDPAALWVYGLR